LSGGALLGPFLQHGKKEPEVKVTGNTEEPGESRELGVFIPGPTCDNEWAERVRSTPAPQAHSDRTGRTHGRMLPWISPLRIVHHAVQCATEQAYA